MSLAVAVPLGVASSLVYGTSIVFQHEAASTAPGDAHPGRLVSLLRNPRWLMAIGGDFIGFVLGVLALSAGSVVVIQPLVVLMLPVALLVGWLAGGPRPRPADFAGSMAIVAGLGVFLGLIGHPRAGRVPHSRYVAVTILIVLGVGVLASFAVTGRRNVVRGAVYGLVAGIYYGTLGVMVDAASDTVSARGWQALVTTGRGLVPLIGVVLLGGGGLVLTQLSFQVGALAATLPASLGADPFTGVLIGALLLEERLPHDALHLVLYALCLAAVVAGALRLADLATGGRAPVAQQAEWDE